jgi:hypothetical protein
MDVSRLLRKRVTVNVHRRRPEQAEERELCIDTDRDDKNSLMILAPDGDVLNDIARHVAGEQGPRAPLPCAEIGARQGCGPGALGSSGRDRGPDVQYECDLEYGKADSEQDRGNEGELDGGIAALRRQPPDRRRAVGARAVDHGAETDEIARLRTEVS